MLELGGVKGVGLVDVLGTCETKMGKIEHVGIGSTGH